MKEMQIKTTLKFCLTVVSMVNKKTSIKCCWVPVYSSAVGNVWKSIIMVTSKPKMRMTKQSNSITPNRYVSSIQYIQVNTLIYPSNKHTTQIS